LRKAVVHSARNGIWPEDDHRTRDGVGGCVAGETGSVRRVSARTEQGAFHSWAKACETRHDRRRSGMYGRARLNRVYVPRPWPRWSTRRAAERCATRAGGLQQGATRWCQSGDMECQRPTKLGEGSLSRRAQRVRSSATATWCEGSPSRIGRSWRRLTPPPSRRALAARTARSSIAKPIEEDRART
jgi:hypothetical protein